MFEKYRKFETTFAGRPLVVETGKTCELSNGSCWVRYGETVVMANVTASAKPREGVDFFPLSVDYEERMYAVGRIPGSFTKREGKPSEKAILTSRMVDRPIRPLFPKDMRNDVSVVMTVLAVDPDCSPEITGMLATSIAISISDIPWNGPIAGISVGLVDGEIVLNPTLEQRAHNDLRLTVAGTMEKIVMIEAGANEIPEQQMLDAILAARKSFLKQAKKLYVGDKVCLDEDGCIYQRHQERNRQAEVRIPVDGTRPRFVCCHRSNGWRTGKGGSGYQRQERTGCKNAADY